MPTMASHSGWVSMKSNEVRIVSWKRPTSVMAWSEASVKMTASGSRRRRCWENSAKAAGVPRASGSMMKFSAGISGSCAPMLDR